MQPRITNGRRFSAETEGEGGPFGGTDPQVPVLTVDSPVDVQRPARCDDETTEPCLFDIYLGGTWRWGTIDLVVLVLEGTAEVVDQGVVGMTQHTVTGTTPTYRFDTPGEQPLRMDLSYDAVADPLAAAMTFVEVVIDEPATGDEALVRAPIRMLSLAAECCIPGVVQTWHHNSDLQATDPFDEPLEFELTWEAAVWSPGEIDANSIAVTIE